MAISARPVGGYNNSPHGFNTLKPVPKGSCESQVESPRFELRLGCVVNHVAVGEHARLALEQKALGSNNGGVKMHLRGDVITNNISRKHS